MHALHSNSGPPPLCHAASVAAALPTLACYSATKLEVTYQVAVAAGPPAASRPVEAAAVLLDNSQLLLVPGEGTYDACALELSR